MELLQYVGEYICLSVYAFLLFKIFIHWDRSKGPGLLIFD